MGKSSVQIRSGDLNIICDAGIKLDEPPTHPLDPGKIDALFLSHSHLDHCGYIPGFFARQKFPLYLTKPAAEVSHMLQMDSLKIDRLKGYKTSYSESDVERLSASEIPVGYGEKKRFHGKMDFTFLDAGHIPGSAGILFELEGKKVFYTGDTNAHKTRLLNEAQYPEEVDVLICESTYGGRLHPPRGIVEKKFLEDVKDTLERGGIALVPAFAVGRAQEVLMVLRDLMEPIYLDGMARKAAHMMLKYPEFLANPKQLEEAVSNAYMVEGRRMRREIVRQGPAVIVTTAGMLEGGPVLDYLGRLHNDPNSSIILTGYQVEDTNGRLLIEKGFVVDEESRKRFKVDMNISQYDFSAHSDHNSLVESTKKMNPEHVVLVHGDLEAENALKQDLDGFKVHTPKIGDVLGV
ncbi:MAG: MBL fold metallo-hydrolase [Candidatus Altiarchaeales archaeon]|nr:MBL fold metallo-hydrolase [Candidatus Altiarchaeales archaeon]